MNALPWLILWLPFAAAGVISFFCLRLPKVAGAVATGTLLVCFGLSVALFASAAKAPFELSSLLLLLGVLGAVSLAKESPQ